MTRTLRTNRSVITIGGLLRLGYSKKEVLGLVRHGELRRVHRGVYADGRMRLTDSGRLHAALLAVGQGAWIAGPSAAVVWGLTQVVPAEINVYLDADHTPRHKGLRISRTSRPPHPSEIRTRTACASARSRAC